jgi:hypothetical protein
MGEAIRYRLGAALVSVLLVAACFPLVASAAPNDAAATLDGLVLTLSLPDGGDIESTLYYDVEILDAEEGVAVLFEQGSIDPGGPESFPYIMGLAPNVSYEFWRVHVYSGSQGDIFDSGIVPNPLFTPSVVSLSKASRLALASDIASALAGREVTASIVGTVAVSNLPTATASSESSATSSGPLPVTLAGVTDEAVWGVLAALMLCLGIYIFKEWNE